MPSLFRREGGRNLLLCSFKSLVKVKLLSQVSHSEYGAVSSGSFTLQSGTGLDGQETGMSQTDRAVYCLVGAVLFFFFLLRQNLR